MRTVASKQKGRVANGQKNRMLQKHMIKHMLRNISKDTSQPASVEKRINALVAHIRLLANATQKCELLISGNKSILIPSSLISF